MPSIKTYINRWYAKRVITISERDLTYYISLMKKAKPFSFSRFGDGEWSAILGHRGENCDGHTYFPQLTTQLRKTLENPFNYDYAIQSYALSSLGRSLAKFIRNHRITISWHNANLFHYANKKGVLYPFIKQLREMQVVLVGPAYLRKLNDTVIHYQHFIEIPTRNCFLACDSIITEIKKIAKPNSRLVFALSASMASNVIIHELYPLLGKSHWFLDLGSLWDVYLGIKSRGVYQTLDWQPIIQKNLGL